MEKKLLLFGVAILLSAILFYPGFYYPPAPKGMENIVSERVFEALRRGEKSLELIVSIKHHSTAWEKKINIIRSMRGLENIGGKLIYIYPNLSMVKVTIPVENLENFLRFPNVSLVDLDTVISLYPINLSGKEVASPYEILDWLGVEAFPGGGYGVDIYVLDTGAPQDIPVETAISFVGGSPYDYNGHGSAVIGIIKFFAPMARIHSLKVLNDDGRGTIGSVIAAVEYALKQPGEKKIINASFGLPETLFCSLKEAFSIFVSSGGEAVVAAGNDPNIPMSPGTCPEVITVGAISRDNMLTSYSYRKFDVVCYGDQVALAGILKDKDIRGTSFSTPVVTGLVARYFSSIRGTTSQVNMEETLKRGSKLTPEGYYLPVATKLSITPPELERTIIPPKLFWPLVITGVSLILSGLFTRRLSRGS